MNAEETTLRQLEKAICDHGPRVRLAEEQDVKRLLAIYYRQDLTTEVSVISMERSMYMAEKSKTNRKRKRQSRYSVRRTSGYDRARGGEVQHRPLHHRQPVSHGDGAENATRP